MVSVFRLKGRGYTIGNVFLVSLYLFSGIVFLFCFNFLPEVIFQLTQKAEPYIKVPAVAMCSLFVLIFGFSVITAIKYGADRFFFRRAQNKGASARDFFYYFKPLENIRLLCFALRLLLIKLLMAAVCFFPSLLCGFILVRLWQSSWSVKVSAVLVLSFAAFFINGIVFFLNFSSLLFLAPYHYIEGTYLNFSNIISMSAFTMEKKRHLLQKLRLSFVGWFALCFLIVPLGYVYAYYKQTLCVAADEFMNK